MIDETETQDGQNNDKDEGLWDDELSWSDLEDLERPIPNNTVSTLNDLKGFTPDLDEFDVVAVDGTYLTTFDAETRKNETDLYNSGASQHMSGFHHKFINLVKIKPIPITATDKRTF